MPPRDFRDKVYRSTRGGLLSVPVIKPEMTTPKRDGNLAFDALKSSWSSGFHSKHGSYSWTRIHLIAIWWEEVTTMLAMSMLMRWFVGYLED